MTPAEAAGQKFQTLVSILERLRGPEGCPWDREQTFETIKPFLLEEAYEVMDAIDRRDWSELEGEIGDLLLQAVFFSQMAAEERLFDVGDALDAIIGKLLRRHPHVFAPGTASAATGADVRKLWSEIKAAEQKAGGGRANLLGSVPRAQPALAEAQQISSRAAHAGFDWENIGQVMDKLREEMGEFEAARGGSPEEQEGEIGDLLFVLVNLARFANVDAEQALRKTNAKFRRRFEYVERALAERGRTPAESSLEEMEALWQQAKR
ncbi:MAG: nucleoside triphosphate pyrophosphohydrolase [Acidobacteria bacterium]|nr:nucleoside triphosphate pyrophosphohydrolase [Acidobacteriota bacterium]